MGWKVAPLLSIASYGSFLWLKENLSFDIVIGLAAYLLMVIVIPRWESFSRVYWNPAAYKGKGGFVVRGGNFTSFGGMLRVQLELALMAVKIVTLIAALLGILAFLVFSTGWRNPFAPVSWFGVNASGWVFDLFYARANDLPNGAHIVSYICPALFGVMLWAKTINRPVKTLRDLIGNPFYGIAALVFIGGVHEILWIGFYYSAYFQYLSWSILYEVLRDVSFVAMCALFILAFWKTSDRNIPLKIFKAPTMIYLWFLIGWFFIPWILGFHPLPITTLNNTNFGQGIYQETPWFSLLWVNALEVVSWVLLWIGYTIQVLRYWRS